MNKVVSTFGNSTWWFSLITQVFTVIVVILIIYYLIKLYKNKQKSKQISSKRTFNLQNILFHIRIKQSSLARLGMR